MCQLNCLSKSRYYGLFATFREDYGYCAVKIGPERFYAAHRQLFHSFNGREPEAVVVACPDKGYFRRNGIEKTVVRREAASVMWNFKQAGAKICMLLNEPVLCFYADISGKQGGNPL